MNEMPLPLVNLMNKTDAGFTAFAFGTSVRVLRVVRDETWCTFRVERLTLTDKNPMQPKGAWHTVSTHTNEQPGAMLQSAMDRLMKEQGKIVARFRERDKVGADERALRQQLAARGIA